MSTSIQEFLASFDLLPEPEKRKVATESLKRTYARNGGPKIDEAHLAALYAEFAAEDVDMAEQGMEDFASACVQRTVHDCQTW